MTVMMFLAQYILCYLLSPQLVPSLIHIACLVTIDIICTHKSYTQHTKTYKLKYIRDTIILCSSPMSKTAWLEDS